MKLYVTMPNFKIEKMVVARFISAFPNEVKKVLKRAGLLIVAHAKSQKLSGQVLGVRSGTLRRSVAAVLVKSTRSPRETIDSVAVGTKVWYGAKWEKEGRAWLRPAFDEKRQEAFNIIKTGIRNTMRGIPNVS
jgi:hypothetical protein